MKKKIRLIIGLLLLLVGIVLLCLPLIQQYQLSQKQVASVQAFEKTTPDELQANLKTKTDFDFQAIRPISATTTMVELFDGNINTDQIIGQIVIPSVNINLTLFNGLNNDNLLAGATTMKAGQVMGEANYAIASHFTTYPDVLFTNLQKVQVGDIVRITDKQMIYVYRVYDAQIVASTDVHLIEDDIATNHGKPIVSLMSCVSLEASNQRFFAFGELIETIPYDAAKMTENLPS